MVQAGTLIKHVKFDAYWTMSIEVISTSFFMAKRLKWCPCHAHNITPEGRLLTTFDPKGVKSTHSDFHKDWMNSLGGVH